MSGASDGSGGRPIEQRLAEAGLPPLPRLCWLEIDESALAGNLRAVRGLVGPDVAISAVVKADAYGHGIEAAARAFVDAGADRLCVAGLDEALLLRRAGIAAPILVLFAIPLDGLADAVAARLELVAADEGGAHELLDRWHALGAATAPGNYLPLHLEVETGLARAGVRPERVARLAARIATSEGVRLAGLWSHLASPDDPAATAAQVDALERATAGLRRAGVPVPPRHLAATGGLFAGNVPLHEGCRPGLSLYGLLPEGFRVADAARAAAEALRPAMALKCRPLRIEELAADMPVGYGGRWRSERASRIATLPVGYGDGWARAYWPGAQALVRGRRVPLVGTVAMDALMVDVTDVPGVALADEFVLLGEQGSERITAQELARVRNTIPWEVVTTMAQRVPRVYHARAVLQGVRTLAGEVRGVPVPGPRS